MKLNNAILAEPQHLPLYDELVASYPVEYIAGGATQNSIRVAQWIRSSTAGADKFAAYIGSVGDDEFGRQLRSAAERDGVTPYYHTAAKPTGTCAVLIHDKERSLVANLSAAECYDKKHWESAPIQKVLSDAHVFYSDGFFLTHSAETMVATGKIAAESNKIYSMNLSAPFLCQFFKDQMDSVLPYADFVFGNESEAAAYGAAHGLEGKSVADVALFIAAGAKVNARRPRIVVITQGKDATIVATNGTVHEVAVPAIASEKIVDTNGAGDAFVGGFLALIAQDKPVDEAVHAGHFAAGHVIQRSGCTFDASVKYVASA